MPAALLDVNLLLALAWPNHIHHDSAHEWFAVTRSQGWATCPLTELAFIRLSAQPTVVKITVAVADAIRTLEANLSAPEHTFWPLQHGITEILPEIRDRLAGHQQVTDALLLDLAIRNKGKLATFDKRIERLLPPHSPHGSALEIVLP